MMLYILFGLSLITFVYSAVIPDDSKATILEYENTNDGKGNYKFRYLTSNDIEREETGTLVNAGQADEHIVVEGYYSYINADGQREYIQYKADQNGFKLLPPVVSVIEISALPGPVTASLLGK